MSRVFVIAEAGIAHDGDLRKALNLIDVAREAKADAVKFQTFNAQKLAARRKSPDLFTKLKPYEMPVAWLPILKDHCDKAGIEFMTTCFDEETVRIVAPFVKRFKIGHGESGDFEFVRAHCGYGKEIIASFVRGCGRPAAINLKHLYVTTSYPTPLEDVRLEEMVERRSHGFSDHTREVLMGSWAVAAGAKIIEVHFMLWETHKDNPDRCVSLAPMELIRYVDLVRLTEVAVYGAASEETKKLVRPGSAPHTSHPQGSGESDPPAYHPAVEP